MTYCDSVYDPLVCKLHQTNCTNSRRKNTCEVQTAEKHIASATRVMQAHIQPMLHPTDVHAAAES